MVNVTTLETLVQLQREMAAADRKVEAEALEQALACVARVVNRADDGTYTTGEAAERLGVSIPTVKRWIERGVLKGVDMGTRWLVAKESVERIVRIRQTLAEMEDEGSPTPEEFAKLRRRWRRRTNGEHVAWGSPQDRSGCQRPGRIQSASRDCRRGDQVCPRLLESVDRSGVGEHSVHVGR